MRVLLVKTSSMGDLVHTLPALTDAAKAIPNIKFDWVVEESFSEIPAWHSSVDRVIPVALRRWRKKLWSAHTWKEVLKVKAAFAERDYDLILDAQGLVKSGWLTWLLRGKRAGLGWRAARERWASLFYKHKYHVEPGAHAVTRTRLLFSLALDYKLPDSAPDFNLKPEQFYQQEGAQPYVVFLHGTTWLSKQWPESYWLTLARQASAAGFRIKISGGSAEEVERAKRIADSCDAVDVMPFLSINSMVALLAGARGAVAVDTGFGHLAAAIGVPIVSIYGATDPALTGALGRYSKHLKTNFPCSPCMNRRCTYRGDAKVKPACYATLPPDFVWQSLLAIVNQSASSTPCNNL